jgi:steroid delta-isomerase-like uncharacterized protein
MPLFTNVLEGMFSEVRSELASVASCSWWKEVDPPGKRTGKEKLSMSEENKALARRIVDEVLSQGNLDVAEEIYAPNYVAHDPANPVEISGPEGIKQFVSMYRSAFPDLHETIEDQIAEGDKVVTRWTGRGTHQGELLGIPPTGNRVTAEGISIDRISGGRVEESWFQYDALGMMQQLGVVPPPGQ